MRKTRISLYIIVAMAISSIPLGFLIVNTTATKPLPDYEPMDIGVEMRKAIEHVQAPDFENMLQLSVVSGYQYVVGDVQIWFTYEAGYGYFFIPFMLRAMNEEAEIWVALDLSFPEGDPRNPVSITDEQCEYMLNEFTGIIIPTDEGYYGMPDELYGNDYWGAGYWYDADAKKVILVSNIIDDSYYDPTYPSYIAGFFSPTIEYYLDRNVISIDAYDWANRVGDDVARPNLYESTVAHEYQHLIHDDSFIVSESWMNEACSLYAEPLCGYELDAGQIEWFLATPDNSLTVWGDQGDINILADYGASYLWALFITSQYGFNFMGDYVKAGVEGIEGINLLLPYGVTFQDIFKNWRIANLIQTNSGPYGYTSFGFTFEGLEPLRVYEVEAKTFDWTTASVAFGETLAGTTAEGDTQYSTGMYEVSAYGSDYFVLDDLRGLKKFYFNGENGPVPFGWTETEMGWYSGAANLYDVILNSGPYTVAEGDVLTINTYWDIEDYWDFGFVQVSTDGGETWTSLANEFTTDLYDPNAHPGIIDNLPGLTSWSTLIFNDADYYVFHDISFDLGAYIDQEVLFRFRFMTDWGTYYEGWYISDAYVGETSLYESLTPEYPEIDFMVTVVKMFETSWDTCYYTFDMSLDEFTEKGKTFIFGTKWLKAVIIVSPMIEIGTADYEFKLSKLHGRHRWCWE